MATKIKDDLEQQIIKLAKEGYNCRTTALKVGLNPETVRQWSIRTGVVFQTGTLEIKQKEFKFIELLKAGTIHKHACKELNIDSRLGKEWAIKHGLESTIRNRAEAAKDKQLTLEEVNSRLPEGHGQVISYDFINKTYVIQRQDSSCYSRILSQIFRGDPLLSEKKRSTEEEIGLKLRDVGYRLIPDTYVKKHQPLKAEHIICGYVRETVFYNIFKQSCPKCSNTGTSQQEIDLDKWIQSLGVETEKFKFKKDCAGKGKGKEIDIYVPKLKIGIEYCGLRFHGERQRDSEIRARKTELDKRGKSYNGTDYDNPRLRHKIKLDKANSLGIQLITIFGNEWSNNQEKVKSILRAKLGKNEHRIFARKTQIREIDKKESKDFLNLYHMQGDAPTLIGFGLFYENELVGVITGGHHHRIKDKFVLNRLCFKSNTTVIGGSSKLSAALENWARINNYDEIISWSDNRWSNGAVYRSLNYVLEKELPPDYFYFDNRGRVYSKQSCQKKCLIKKGAIGNTEWEMAQSLKLDRIWDCGKKTWVKKL